MNPDCSVFIATSLDGYIARDDGSIDWLEAANATVPPGEDCGYADFVATVDLLVIGSGTFEKLLLFAQWPYGDMPVWVVSRSRSSIPAHLPPQVRLIDGTPDEIAAVAGASGYRRLYVDGGKLIQSFITAGLITDLTITTIPLLLGGGRSLFGAPGRELKLELRSSRAYPCGFVQSTWRVVGSAPTA